MLTILRPDDPHRFSVALLLGIALSLPCAAQMDALTPGSTTIQTELLPAGLDGKYDGEGFVFGIGANAIYDSNIFISEDDEESDFSFAASPWVSFNSAPPGGARVILNARYAPFVRAFLKNSDLNTIDHAGSATLSYEGAKVRLHTSANYSRFTQTDRFAGGLVEGSSFGFSVGGSYQVSEKTSLQATWSAIMSDYQSGRFSSADSYSLLVTGFWQATPLFRVGPSLRHSQIDSGTIGRREALAFLVSLGYEVTGKISLNAAGGVEFEDYERSVSGDTEVQLTGNLGISYRYDDLWSFQAGVDYQTIPSPSTNNQSIDDLGLRASVTRGLRNGSLSAGATTNFSYYQAVGPMAAPRDDEHNFSLFLGHRMNIFDERVNLDSSLRFSKNDGQRDWSRFQLSTGLSYVF